MIWSRKLWSTVSIVLMSLLAVVASGSSAWAATYFSQGSLAPNLTASWNTVRAGGGAAPANFTAGDVFVIQNAHSMTTTAAWATSGASSRIQIESGGMLTSSGIFLVSTPNFQVDNGGTYVHGAATNTNGATSDIPGSTSRTFGASGTVEIQRWGDGTGTALVALPSGVTWGNLRINVATLGGAWQQSGALTSVAGNLIISSTGG